MAGWALMHDLIRKEQSARRVTVSAVGGLTMGADPVALAVGMYSHWAKDESPVQVFSVRKSPKAHGQTKLIEGISSGAIRWRSLTT